MTKTSARLNLLRLDILVALSLLNAMMGHDLD